MHNLLDSDSFFTHDLRRDLLKASSEELDPLRDHMPSAFVDFSKNVYSWPDLDKAQKLDFDLVTSLSDNQRVFDHGLLTINDCNKVFSRYTEILKLNLNYLTSSQIEQVLAPFLKRISLPFISSLMLQLMERLEWNKIPAIWNSPAFYNPDLIELRRAIIDNLETGVIVSDLPAFRGVPFIDRTIDDYDGGTEAFIRSLIGKDLSIKELDFVISSSEWLFKDTWGDFHDAFREILFKNSDKLSYFTDDYYRFYIWRAYNVQ